VKAAEQVGMDWIVTEGVTAGEKVVVSNLSRLRPGTVVHAIPAEGSSTASAESDSEKRIPQSASSSPSSSSGNR